MLLDNGVDSQLSANRRRSYQNFHLRSLSMWEANLTAGEDALKNAVNKDMVVIEMELMGDRREEEWLRVCNQSMIAKMNRNMTTKTNLNTVILMSMCALKNAKFLPGDC